MTYYINHNFIFSLSQVSVCDRHPKCCYFRGNVHCKNFKQIFPLSAVD